MAEIGASLREARMRQRIDLAQVEAETKIRAKYLRALENEEWHVLPGPAYVKTFLRAYADRLGLDGRLLVEEYKLAHDRLSDTELRPISSRAGARARTRRPPRTIPRAWIVGIVVLALVAALYALGRTAEDDGGAGTTGDPGRAQDAGARPAGADRGERPRVRRRRAAPPRRVRLQVVPEGPVYVCLADARGRLLVPGEILAAGDATRTFRSRSFRLVLGNGAVRLRLNGRLRDVPQSAEPIAYAIDRRGRRPLPAARRPDCR